MKKAFSSKSIRLTVFFSIAVFLILVITMFIMGFIVMTLFNLGILQNQHRGIMIFCFAIASIIVGTIFSKIIGKPLMSNITEISEATKEVAKGNFSVTLNDNIPALELRVMAQNFNLMTQELAKTEIFRNDFISNVSHEFKTPLSAIEGYAALLQNESLSSEKRSAYTERIIYNTKRLAALTGNILLLSRLENQSIPPKKESFSLDEQIREMILLFTDEWTEKNLDMDIDLEAVNYYGSFDLLSQVWQNLIGNAVKFSNKNGFIRIMMRQTQENITVSICDNGCGMNQETANRIFEKFYQGDTSRASEGNGLGLTLAKRIIELHNGTISVSSKEGKGTTFTVIL